MADIYNFKKAYEQRFLRTLTGKFVDLLLYAAVPEGQKIHVLQFNETDAAMIPHARGRQYHCIDQADFDEFFHPAAHAPIPGLSKQFALAGGTLSVLKQVEARLYHHHIEKIQSAFADGCIDGKTRVDNGGVVVTPKGGEAYFLSLPDARTRLRLLSGGQQQRFPL